MVIVCFVGLLKHGNGMGNVVACDVSVCVLPLDPFAPRVLFFWVRYYYGSTPPSYVILENRSRRNLQLSTILIPPCLVG